MHLNSRVLQGIFLIALFSGLFACNQEQSDGPAFDGKESSEPINAEVESPGGPFLHSAPSLTSDELSSVNELITNSGFAGLQAPQVIPGKTSESDFLCQHRIRSVKQAEESLCRAISNRLASVSMPMCQDAELTLSGCESVQGFPILVREFPPLSNRTPQGRILVIGGTHGDELTSVSIMFRWIEKLNKYHSGLFHWRMVPLLNPDGVLRKEATRTNQNGVDLNRNLPTTDWEEKALPYWETKGERNPRRYPGKQAASEPEVHWLIDEIEHFKPDAIISVHAPYGMVDFDALRLANAPKSLGKLHLNLLGTYPGSLGNYAGINRNIPVITLELPHAWEMPSQAESTKIWEDIVGWLKRNVNQEQQSIAE